MLICLQLFTSTCRGQCTGPRQSLPIKAEASNRKCCHHTDVLDMVRVWGPTNCIPVHTGTRLFFYTAEVKVTLIITIQAQIFLLGKNLQTKKKSITGWYWRTIYNSVISSDIYTFGWYSCQKINLLINFKLNTFP